MKVQSINKYREDVFFISAIITVLVFPFSEALVSISSGLLLLQAILLRSWFHPSHKSRSFKPLAIILSIFVIYLMGALFTKDSEFALYELRKVVFWIVIPLAVWLSPKLSERKVYLTLVLFIASVTIASLVFSGKLILHNYFGLTDIRTVGYISHIRFSFQVVLSIILIGWLFLINNWPQPLIFRTLMVVNLLWLICFLVLLQSLLGIIAFMGTIAFATIFYMNKIENKSLQWSLWFIFLLAIVIPAIFTIKVIVEYYDFKELDHSSINHYTPSGNCYEFDFENGMRENGHLVYTYICHNELRNEWNKRSELKYDDLINGYPLNIVLIRYLTSMGLRKDSAAIVELTHNDIDLIEKGVTNYKFHNRFLSIYPRVYETIWEIDNYIRTGDPNRKSLAQRIEFMKASVLLIKENPLFGVGTGNWAISYSQAYHEMGSLLKPENQGPSHNQYLNYLVKFGLAGFLWIFAAIAIPFFMLGHQRNFIFITFMVAIALANFGDANLETHMGLSFFSFFYSMFLWNSTGKMLNKLN